MSEILHASLKDDNTPETFPLRHLSKTGVRFPSRFVKVEPISAYGNSFHISIWFVSLAGIADEEYVKDTKLRFDEVNRFPDSRFPVVNATDALRIQHRENAALRHILKHLRQRRFLGPFKAIMSCAGVELEHPLVTELYDNIVSNGNWSAAEQAIDNAASAGLFDAYLNSKQPHAVWRRLYGVDANGDVPSRRGGHAMCIDEQHGHIYMFGGWDGQKSLDDLWVYDIETDRWRMISQSVLQEQHGPRPRSCHKMAFDSKTGAIYVLGGLLESDSGAADSSNSWIDPSAPAEEGRTEYAQSYADFYRYHTQGPDSGTWELLSKDTSSTGGPPLIFDHQMVMDTDRQVLYVNGGRVNDATVTTIKYSGFYSYTVSTGKWKLLHSNDGTLSALSHRFGHSMVLDPNERTLYIFAGMGEEKYLSDMHTYNIDTQVATELFSNFTAAGGPDKTFTQRAVIDPSCREIYVFCGLTRGAQSPLPRLDLPATSWICRYGDPSHPWTKILPEEPGDGDGPAQIQQPRARYAHQVVYDSRSKTVYLHGGNAGRLLENGELDENPSGDSSVEQRLDDFWCMKLKRPGPGEIIRRARFQIRCQQFRELCADAPAVVALRFLQTQVHEVVDHSTSEAHVFRELLSYMLAEQSRPETSSSQGTAGMQAGDEMADGAQVESDAEAADGSPEVPEDRFKQRTEVFESLLEFFPADAKQPSSNLVDMIGWYEESIHE
ncbi:hypothetical protein EWM64_g3025 [Hericium alpestre]|uniref:Muskelin N-terminal domain-containing protein n=1 Tax=Hericium alpestre TaxID=135208 RepID=A0A4Z0A2L7_9AGAM|nr:hypothetical protein EWM64_g3025 [Hericium alpestre]